MQRGGNRYKPLTARKPLTVFVGLNVARKNGECEAHNRHSLPAASSSRNWDVTGVLWLEDLSIWASWRTKSCGVVTCRPAAPSGDETQMFSLTGRRRASPWLDPCAAYETQMFAVTNNRLAACEAHVLHVKTVLDMHSAHSGTIDLHAVNVALRMFTLSVFLSSLPKSSHRKWENAEADRTKDKSRQAFCSSRSATLLMMMMINNNNNWLSQRCDYNSWVSLCH